MTPHRTAPHYATLHYTSPQVRQELNKFKDRLRAIFCYYACQIPKLRES
jgi:hypothetical protein